MNTDNYTLYQNTPEVTVADNRGLIVREIRYCRHPDTLQSTDEQITRHQFNARGHLQRSIDPRLYDLQDKDDRANFRYLTSLAGEVLRTQSTDAGTTVMLKDIAERPVLSINAVNVKRTWQYEAAARGRLLSITEQADSQPGRIVERLVWSDDSQRAKEYNLAGSCVRHYDPAGLVQTHSVSLTGTPLSISRRLLPDEYEVDWQGKNEDSWDAPLSSDTFTTQTTADGTGALLTETDAKGNMSRLVYDVAGLLCGSWLTLKGQTEQVIIKSLTYSTIGQKLREEHGNGIVTTYNYEPATQRLIAIKTERPSGHPSGAKVLQDLRYEYDPAGNVLKVRNNAEVTCFWRNQKVEPENTYAYDSLYQLVSASGREMATNAQQSTQLPACVVPLPTDSSTYTCYTRDYCYDRGGNLIQIRHSAPATGNTYTKQITVSEHSNRAVLSTLSDDASKVDGLFDTGGHQLQLVPGQPLTWTGRGELRQVTLVRRDSRPDIETYRYDGGSRRVVKRTIQQASDITRTQLVVYLPGLELRTTQIGETIKESLQTITVGNAGRAQVRALHWETGRPGVISNNQLRYSYDNLIGSSALEVDGAGELISQEEYYPYGGTAISSARTQVETNYKTVRYSGKERDATGLYYYGWRYYQPWVGRWLSADPAQTVDGLNVFKMVGNNPISFSDSDGLQKNGHLYIHYHNFDAMHYIAGFNARRIMRGKAPYPVLVESEEFKGRLLSVRETLRSRTEVLEEDKSDNSRQAITQNYLDGKGIRRIAPERRYMATINKAVFKAVENIDVKVGGLSQLTVTDKLYLLGHGHGGKDIVGTDSSDSFDLDMKGYAQKLKEANLSSEIRDIRAIWCESGDAKSNLKVIAEPPLSISQVSETETQNTNVVPAQALSSALAEAGYRDTEVSGYKGLVSIYPLSDCAPIFYKERFLEVTQIYSMKSKDPLVIDKKTKVSDAIRASTLRRIYKNGNPVHSTRL